MPSLELRGRYVLREYWGDAELFRRLTAAEREVYIGLWMLADDRGILPRDIPEIAAALFRFEEPGPRETRVRATLEKLKRLRKIVSQRCGCIFIPAVVRYPRSGNKNTTHSDVHRAEHINHVRTSSTMLEGGSDPSPDLTPNRSTLSLPNPASAREDEKNGTEEGGTEFRRRVPRPGAGGATGNS